MRFFLEVQMLGSHPWPYSLLPGSSDARHLRGASVRDICVQDDSSKLHRLLIFIGLLLGASVLLVAGWRSGHGRIESATGRSTFFAGLANETAGDPAVKLAFSQTTSSCGVFEYESIDPAPFRLPFNNPYVGTGQRLQNLKVSLDQWGHYTTLQVPEPCAEKLRSHGVQRLRVTSANNGLQELDYSIYDGGLGSCTSLSGTWLILSAGDQIYNLYHLLSGAWYHIWMVRKKLFSQHEGPLYITHLNGIRDGRSHPFLPIYQPLGEYRQWEDLGVAQAGCLEFEDVLMWSSAYILGTKPEAVPVSGASPLQEFVADVLTTLEVDSVQLDSCPRLALYSARDNIGQHSHKARWVINADQLLAAMNETLQGHYEVQRVVMGNLEFVEAMRLMRRASIYVFPHGGSGPNLLWMRRGTVVIELFPFKSADPMYRNFAVLTGKVYLSWQAQEFAEKGAKVGQPGYQRAYHGGGYHFNAKSAFNVVLEEMVPLLRAAAWVVKANQGDGWAPINAAAFHTYLCPWSNTTLSYQAWTACDKGGKRR